MKVVVMLGGPSSERAVSLRSGAAVAGALRLRGHEVVEVDPQASGWSLPEDVGVVFLALHGTYGEDGTVQSILDRMGVPYTGCGAESSRVAFDKVETKTRCLENGVPTAPYRVLRARDELFPEGWSFPVVLKPLRQGSSVGLQFVDREEDWSRALSESLQHDTEVLMESRIVGREVTVGILGGRALPVVEVRPKTGCYDYERKYTPGQTEYLCPAPLGESVTQRVQEAALGAFRAVGGRDYARVDVMIDGEGNPVVLEVNTLPGMTVTSLLPKAAAAAGIEFGVLCERMVEMALEREKEGLVRL